MIVQTIILWNVVPISLRSRIKNQELNIKHSILLIVLILFPHEILYLEYLKIAYEIHVLYISYSLLITFFHLSILQFNVPYLTSSVAICSPKQSQSLLAL